MSVSKTGHDLWYSSLTEQTYTSEAAAKKYDNEERMRSSVESEESKYLDSLSPEELKRHILALNARTEKVQGDINWKHVQQDFVNANPEYLPNDANGRTLATALATLGILDPVADVFLGTMDDMQEVYVDLAQKGMLQLHAGARLPQRARANEVDPADPYTLPMEELKRRAGGW